MLELKVGGRTHKELRRIKKEVRKFFKELYHQKEKQVMSFDSSLVQRLSGEDAAKLEAIPSMEKIKDAV